jgi:drug/metabolite transporter (DMT)-like permease
LTALAFYFKYGERISKWDMIGALLYLSSNVLVVIGAKKSIFENGEHALFLVCVAFGMAAMTGVIDTLSVLNLRFIIKDV